VFGVEPLPLLIGASALVLMVALALLVTGRVIPAIVPLMLIGVLATFVRTGMRRDPESRLAHAAALERELLDSQREDAPHRRRPG
jgi:hypothetical protein